MPWVVRPAVDEINRAVGRRWQGLDRLLPPRAELPVGYRPLWTRWEVRPAASLR
jgi:hypothetical protein